MVSLRSSSPSSSAASARVEEERLTRGNKANSPSSSSTTTRWLGISSTSTPTATSTAISFPVGTSDGSFSSESSSESFSSPDLRKRLLESKSKDETDRNSSSSDTKPSTAVTATTTTTLLLDAESDIETTSDAEDMMRANTSSVSPGGVPKLRSMKNMLIKSRSSSSFSMGMGRRSSSSRESSGSVTGPPPFAENGSVSASPAVGRDSTSSISTHESSDSNTTPTPTVTFLLPSTSDADALSEYGGRRARQQEQQQQRGPHHAHTQSQSWLERASLVVEMSTDEEDDDTDFNNTSADDADNDSESEADSTTSKGPQDDEGPESSDKEDNENNNNNNANNDDDLDTLFDSDSDGEVSVTTDARNSYRSTSSSGSKRVMRASHSHTPSGSSVRGLGLLSKHGRTLSSAAVRASNRSMRLMSAFSLVDKLFAQEDQLQRDVGEQASHEQELFWHDVDPTTANVDHPIARERSGIFRKRLLRKRRGRNGGSTAGGQPAAATATAGGRVRRRRRSTGNSVNLTVAQLARLNRNTREAIDSVEEGDETEDSEFESEGLESDDGVGSLRRPQHRRQASSRRGLFRGSSLQSVFRTSTGSASNNNSRHSSDTNNRLSRGSGGARTGVARSLHGQKRSFLQLPGIDALRGIGGSFSSTRNRFFSSRGGSNVDGLDFADGMSNTGTAKSGGMVETPLVVEEEHVVEYIFCPVCIEDVDDREAVKVQGCDHVFCRDCFHVHLKFEIFSGRRHEGMRCPYPGCKTTMADDVWLESEAVLGKERFAMLAAWEAQHKVKHNPTLFGCTTEGCPTVFTWDGDRPSLNDSESTIRRYYGPGCPMHANCGACSADFCLGCNEDPFHHGRACTPSRKANGLGTRAVLARGAAGSMDDLTRDFLAQNVVQCGNCGNGIDRRNSTTNTVCVCGHQFCMVCGVEEKDGVMECGCAYDLFYRRRMAKMVKNQRRKAEKRTALKEKYIPEPMRRVMSGRGQVGGRGQAHRQQRPTGLPPPRRRSTMLRIRARLGLQEASEVDANGTAVAENSSPMTIGLLLDHMSEEAIDSRLMTPEEQTQLEGLLSPVKMRRAMRDARFEVLARQELDRARQERRRRRRELRAERRAREQLLKESRERVERAASEAHAAHTSGSPEDGADVGYDFEPQVVVPLSA